MGFELALVGAIILIGLFAEKLYKYTRIPDIFFLIAAGVLVGPASGLVNAGALQPLLPFFTAIALAILLFSSGTRFDVLKVLDVSRSIAGLSLLLFLITAVFVFGVGSLLGYGLFFALFIAVVLSDTDPTIISAIIPQLRVSERVKISLSLESTITGTLATAFAVSLLPFMLNQKVDLAQTTNFVLSQFAVSLFIGFLAGIVFAFLLARIKETRTYAISTLGALLLIYAFVDGIRANGAIATFAFGLVLGNVKTLVSQFKMKIEGTEIVSHQVHEFLSFLVRAFFFAYMGIVLPLKIAVTPLVFAVLAVVAIVVARLAVFKVLKPRLEAPRLETFAIPTGLTAIVLSFLPQQNGIIIPDITQVIFYAVILTNVITAFAVYFGDKQGSAPQIVASREPKQAKK